jgi:sensor histidine kinase YesM
VEDGDLNTKILPLPDNEFAYVFEQFNWMTDRIRQLIDSTVKEQQLRSQAEMRQLQLQINPHFLYNCLSYIVTVAEKPKAVTQMAVLLSRYYRYCTKSKAVTTIGEEVAYAQAYLSIMAMRKSIECDVSVAEELYPLPVIPLILQPIIENAIEHGIEERENAKHVFVKAYPVIENRIRVEVSDDGSGMSREEMERLKLCLRKKESTEGEGIGLWNVNQRLINYYGETSGLEFDTSIWGGLRVSFTFLPKEDGDDGFDRGR